MRRRLTLLTVLLPLLSGAAPAAASTLPPPAIETAITAGPAEGSTIDEAEPAFSFSATLEGAPMPGAVFQCAVDDAPPVSCASPFRLPALEEEGPHAFSVYAEDPLSLARDPSPAVRDFSFQAAEEDEEECGAEEEDEFEEDEAEGIGAEEECETEEGEAPPAECLLRSARASLIASPTHEKVRLVVRYTTYSPTEVEVAYRVGGPRGPLKLGDTRAHFSRHGVFKDTERLSKGEAAKVRLARRFTVELDVPAAPGTCRRYELRHLTERKSAHGQAVWLQSGSPFGSDG